MPVIDLTHLPPRRLPSGARVSRWIALAIGAGLATFWISSRVRDRADLTEPPAPAGVSPAEAPTEGTELEGPAEPPTPVPAESVETAPSPAATESAASPTSAARERTLDGVMDAALTRARACARPGAPASVSEVTVTFAPSGKVSSARVEGESLTDEGLRACVLGHLRGLTIPAFEGNELRVSRELALTP